MERKRDESPSNTVPMDDWGTALGLLSFDHELPRNVRLELFQRGDEIVVRADLPGLKSKDVSVELDDHALTIKGERKTNTADLLEALYRTNSVAFARRIPLPPGVDRSAMEATFENGVLEVTLKLRPGVAPATQTTPHHGHNPRN